MSGLPAGASRIHCRSQHIGRCDSVAIASKRGSPCPHCGYSSRAGATSVVRGEVWSVHSTISPSASGLFAHDQPRGWYLGRSCQISRGHQSNLMAPESLSCSDCGIPRSRRCIRDLYSGVPPFLRSGRVLCLSPEVIARIRLQPCKHLAERITLTDIALPGCVRS